MKIDEGKILLLLAGILSGIVVTSLIINTTIKPTRFLTFSQYQNINMEINEANLEIKGLDKEYAELSQKLDTYKNSSDPNKKVIDAMKNDLANVQILNGDTDVEGPGIRLTIDDRHKSSYEDYNDVMNSITHNFDLEDMVNDLKAAGAEAISINGQRIVDTTSFECTGPTIMINKESVVPPFEILAIGDPDGLAYALTLPDSHYQELAFRQLYLRVDKLEDIKIGAYDKMRQFNYAAPVKVK